MNSITILRIYQRLCDDVGRLKFSLPVEFVYNPLAYAWDGEVNAVKNFLGIDSIKIFQPQNTHVSYPVDGLDCKRSEVSGKRLWGLFQEKFGTAENFFAENFVLNYCPLLFIGRSEKGSIHNITPDKLIPSERDELCELCDEALIEAVETLRPDFVAGVGTGGTLTGTGEYLRFQNPNVKIIAVEPAGSPVLSSGRSGSHKIQGIGAGFVPEVLNTRLYNEIIAVKDDDAINTGKLIGKVEGFLVGISSGAALYAAIEIAKRDEAKGKNIAVILPDTGERYLSTALFAD